MNEKKIAGLINAMANGHYRRGLGGPTGGELVRNAWRELAQAIDESGDTPIEHTHHWSYNGAVNAIVCRCGLTVACDDRLPEALAANETLA